MKRTIQRMTALIAAVVTALGITVVPAAADPTRTGGLLGGGHKYIQPGRDMNHNETFVSDEG